MGIGPHATDLQQEQRRTLEQSCEQDVISMMQAWGQSHKRLRKSRQRALKLLMTMGDEAYMRAAGLAPI